MKKRMLALMIIFCFCLSNILPQTVSAAENLLKISVKAGFNEKVKGGHGFPLQVTVENPGGDFRGDLLFNFNASYNASGAKAIAIDIPKGGKKVYTIALPGWNEDNPNMQNKQTIFLYKGSWKDGHEQSFSGPKTIRPTIIDESYQIIGILSEDPDRLRELKGFTSNMQTETIVLSDKMIAEDAVGLAGLDYIVIDEYGLAKLKDAQQNALLHWVQNGGTLIVGAAPNAAQEYGSLYQAMPMKSEREASAETIFLQAGGGKVPFKTIPVFTGEVEQNASIVEKSGNIPVIIKKGYGSGIIWQTAFSLGDQPFAGWNGYADWFENTFLDQQNMNTGKMQYSSQLDMYTEFANSNEYFPTTHFSLWQISMMLFIYVLLAAPFLYFLLKRFDKREHAWWIVAGFALITSIGIFMMGAKDRLAMPQLNQMGIYQAESGRLSGIGAVSFLSNTGGDYQLNFSKGMMNGVPGGTGISAGDGKRMAVLEGPDKITFPNVEYWSVRSVFGRVTKDNAGSFETSLKYAGTKLTGEITNHFPYDFSDLVIWTGQTKVSLGAIKKGETITVNETFKEDLLTAPISYINYPQLQTYQDVEKAKKESMEYNVVNTIYNSERNEPILYGYTNHPIIQADINQKKEKLNSMNLIYQPLNIDWSKKGEFTINDSMFTTSLNVFSGGIMDEMKGTNQKQLDAGEYNYNLNVPKQLLEGKATLNELQIRSSGQNINCSLLNQQTGEFVPLKDSTVTIGEHIDRFLSKEGTITIKMVKSGQEDPLVTMPSVLLKGEMVND